MSSPRNAKTLAEAVEALRLHNIAAEAREDLAWRGSLEKLRLQTEEQKTHNDAHAAKVRR
jgi:hypothetical protein